MNDCVAECPECGQDVPVRFGPSPDAAARLIEEWPTARREPTVGELGLCSGSPADDAMRWTPDAHNFPEEGQT